MFKKYSKKEYIISNYTLFALFVLFVKKLNDEFKFYINYRRFNIIIKKIDILSY